MDENESGSDSTSSTLTLNSVVDTDAKAKDGAATNGKGGQTEPMDKKTINAQKLRDEVHKVRSERSQRLDQYQAMMQKMFTLSDRQWCDCDHEFLQDQKYKGNRKIARSLSQFIGSRPCHNNGQCRKHHKNNGDAPFRVIPGETPLNKAILLGTTFLVDYMYFEYNGNNQ